MKLLARIGAIALVVLAIMVVPHIHKYVVPLNTEIAATLQGLGSDEVSTRTIDCLNGMTENRGWWHLDDADDLRAHDAGLVDWDRSQSAIIGRVGWHAAWVAIIAIEDDRAVAFDLHGDGSEAFRPLFRTDLPGAIVVSLKRCGVAYGGTYHHPDMPDWYG